MQKMIENIPTNDPVAIPEKKAQIDAILEANKNLAGGLMVYLK